MLTGGNIVTSTKIIGCRGELSIYGDPGGARGVFQAGASRCPQVRHGRPWQSCGRWGRRGFMDVNCVCVYVLFWLVWNDGTVQIWLEWLESNNFLLGKSIFRCELLVSGRVWRCHFFHQMKMPYDVEA